MVFYFLVRSFLINFKKDFINNELNYKGYFLENIELYTIFTDFNSVELDKILNYDNNLSHYDYEYDNIFFEKLLYISRYKNFYRHPIDNFDIFYFLKNDQ
jgi:hypothetical protein